MSMSMVALVYGVPVRVADCLKVLRKPLEDCDHVKADPKLRKLLVDERDKLRKRSPAHEVLVRCPFCTKPVDEYTPVEVVRWTGEPPTKRFPVYIEDASQLHARPWTEGGVRQEGIAIVGKVLWEAPYPNAQKVMSVPETVRQDVKDRLTRMELWNADTVGLYAAGYSAEEVG